MTDQMLMQPTDAFAELGRIRFHEMPFDDVLTRLADLAKRTVPGADEVSVTLVGPGGAHTAASTGALPLTVEAWQYEHGHGPCLAASAANITVRVPDVAGESRWPDWAEHAIHAGAHSCLSVGLPLHESVTGALNVYATGPDAFDDDAVILVETFAGYAAVAMANAHLYDANCLARHMQDAMDRRAVIEQAKGIVMGDRRCTAEEAWEILQKIAQYADRDIGDVAAGLVTGTAESSRP
ncbi:MAG TPA: GAF and ANTAR domain-containing protein [Actinoplanes sp.]